jgi:PAS domain-containing protein
MGEKEPLEDTSLTHSMCPTCYEHYNRMWEGLSLGEYLDDFEQPVIIVEGEGRVVAANQAMADMLGKSDREMYGFLGGEAMECDYARLPEGCGRTVHCKTCTIRNVVDKVRETGKSLVRQPAFLNRRDGRLDLIISAYKINSVVRVVIEQVLQKS